MVVTKWKLGVHHLILGQFRGMSGFKVSYFRRLWVCDMEAVDVIGETSLLDDSNIDNKISERNKLCKP